MGGDCLTLNPSKHQKSLKKQTKNDFQIGHIEIGKVTQFWSFWRSFSVQRFLELIYDGGLLNTPPVSNRVNTVEPHEVVLINLVHN